MSVGCFSSDECLLKNIRLLLWYFSVIDLEVTQLDTIATGLKTMITASNDFCNFIESLPVDLLWKAKKVLLFKHIKEAVRHACYSLGMVANQIIYPKIEDAAPKEEGEAESKKIDFSRLVLLQGGLEVRFIPELSAETK